MSISGKQTINIGLPNESVGSDSLYTAFTKTQNNFDIVFACASPYSTFTAGNGISVNANSSAGSVVITNFGVTNIIAGTNIVISGANGNVTISSTGGGNGGGGTVTSIGVTPVSTDRLTTTGSPIISSGNINIDLAVIANITPATYTNPNVTVDVYGRVTAVSNGASAGFVTSVGLTPGTGIQINGGPITSNGNITVTNIGVTRVSAGTGIAVSSSNGNVTISSTSSGGTVTAVGVSSSQLVVSGSPVVSSGTIAVNLPNSVTFSGSVTANTLNLPNNITITSTTGNTTGINSSYSLSNIPLSDIAYGNATTTNLEFLKVDAPTIGTTTKIGDIISGSSNLAYTSTVVGAVQDFGPSWGVPVLTTWFNDVPFGDTFNISGPTVWNFSGNAITTFPSTGNVNLGNVASANYFTAKTMYLSGSENLISLGTANLKVTASYFTTTGPSTAVLAAGTAGLIKTFMMVADGGDMVITVTNAGWKTSGTGTITFNDIGDSCTLQYVNSKWYAIGINGVTFA